MKGASIIVRVGQHSDRKWRDASEEVCPTAACVWQVELDSDCRLSDAASAVDTARIRSVSSRRVGAALRKQGERDAVCCDVSPERSEGPRGRRGSGSPMTLTFPLHRMDGSFCTVSSSLCS